MMKFKNDYIHNALNALNFQTFSEIQEKVIPYALKGRDVIGVSETGSGKTHAFLLPLLDNLDNPSNLKYAQALIVAPTRELAKQIESMIKAITEHADFPVDIRTFAGGSDRNREIERLKKHQPDIVIGTPGRLEDLIIKEKVLHVHTVKTFVIDEADMALDQGFIETLGRLASIVNTKAQMMVFTATLPKHLKHFVEKSMHHPHQVILDTMRLKELKIRHQFMRSARENRDQDLLKLLGAFNPYLALIFTNSKDDAERLKALLYQEGLSVTALHGDLSARQRKQVMREIDNLKVQYIVASDMAARGMDIKGISHIVNYEFPRKMHFYIHRSGRTGRMGMEGEVITLYDKRDHEAFAYLEKEHVRFEFITVKNGEIVVRENDREVIKKTQKKYEYKNKQYDKHRK